MNSWTPEEVQKTLDLIKERIVNDKVYKNFCLENPHAAILELTGKELPTGLQVNFSETGEALLVIEAYAADLPEGELCDADLEFVSGGVSGYSGIKAWWHVMSPKRTKVIANMPTGVAGIRG